MLRCRMFLCIALGVASQLSAATILRFDGTRDREEVLEFYNGGTGSLGSFYLNYGVSFAPGAVAIIDSDVGGTGNFANAPSNFAVLFSTTGLVQMNVSSGFYEALTFYYATHGNGPTGGATIYSGLNGTGSVLGSATAPPPRVSCPGNPSGGFYGCWQAVTIQFSGTARSVVFDVPANQFLLDNITLSFSPGGLVLNPSAGVPEPATWSLMGAALLGVWLRSRRRPGGNAR